MREIKFRGKRIDNGKWVYGYYHLDDSGEGFDAHYITTKHDLDVIEIDPETVGQYANIKDKSKTEIYEDDISKQTYHTQAGSVHEGTDITFDGHHIGAVVITARGVCLKNPLHYSVDTDETTLMKAYKQIAGYRSEVIGNIHDNPELLEAPHD